MREWSNSSVQITRSFPAMDYGERMSVFRLAALPAARGILVVVAAATTTVRTLMALCDGAVRCAFSAHRYAIEKMPAVQRARLLSLQDAMTPLMPKEKQVTVPVVGTAGPNAPDGGMDVERPLSRRRPRKQKPEVNVAQDSMDIGRDSATASKRKREAAAEVVTSGLVLPAPTHKRPKRNEKSVKAVESPQTGKRRLKDHTELPKPKRERK